MFGDGMEWVNLNEYAHIIPGIMVSCRVFVRGDKNSILCYDLRGGSLKGITGDVGFCVRFDIHMGTFHWDPSG